MTSAEREASNPCSKGMGYFLHRDIFVLQLKVSYENIQICNRILCILLWYYHTYMDTIRINMDNSCFTPCILDICRRHLPHISSEVGRRNRRGLGLFLFLDIFILMINNHMMPEEQQESLEWLEEQWRDYEESQIFCL